MAKEKKENRHFLKIRNNWRALIVDDQRFVNAQFTVVFIFFAVVSAVMSVMNYFTHFEKLMWSTVIFSGANVFNALLCIKKTKLQYLARVLFALEILALFCFFIIVGEPEGFSAIWAALLPVGGLLLYRGKKGSILAAIEFIIIAFFFWTPWGRGFLQIEYTEPFMMRFPVLYLAFFGVGIFFEIVRYSTYRELVDARDKYKDLYTDEAVNARAEKERNFEIISVLASEYSAVFYVHLDTEKYEVYSATDKTSEYMGDFFSKDSKYTDTMARYIALFVENKDKNEMLKSTNIEKVKEMLTTDKSYTITFRQITSSGPHYHEMKFVKMGNVNDAPTICALALGDKDGEIRAREEYQRQLQEAKENAERSSLAKSQFLFNMSHDIRTPMNAIIGFAQMAKRNRNNPEKVVENLDKVILSSGHLLQLISDVLDMSKIDSGKVDIELKETDISKFTENVKAMFAQDAKKKKLEFKVKQENIRDKIVLMDSLRMDQVILNVVSNAIKYTGEGGRVYVDLEQVPFANEDMAKFVITVKDTGIGMSPEFLSHIYESFERENNTTMSGVEGTGLGMAICKSLLDLMGGSIDIQSQVSVGTTVTITICLEKVKTEVETKDKEEVKEKGKVSLKGKRALLVDDNELNREIAKDILEMEGMIVEEADDGDVSVDMVKSHEPTYYDVVLMDIQMPNMNGYEATKVIRALNNADYTSLPIIAVTANAFEEDRRNAFAAGMDEHIPKPIDPEFMFATIKKFIK